MIKSLNYFLQAILVFLFFLIARIVGLKLSRKIFALIFSFIGPFFKSRKIIDKNLDTSFQGDSELDRKKIIKNMWKNYGMTFVEYIFLNKFRKSNSHVFIDKEKNLAEIIKSKKPVIFVSGHFANFELMSMEITKNDIKLATIYRPLNNFFLNPFMEYLRKKYICQNQIKKGINGVRKAIKYIKEDYSIALMIDQRVSEGEKISFFGKPALTTTLPAQLSAKFNIDIVPVFIKRKKDSRFEIEFKETINSKNYKNKQELSEKLNRTLEKMIIKNPDQWIWTHNRWK